MRDRFQPPDEPSGNGHMLNGERRSSGLWSFLARRRAALQMTMDVTAWAVALLAGTWLRYDFAWERVTQSEVPTAVAIAGTAQVVVGLVSGLYLGRRRYGSFEEVALLTGVAGVAMLLTLAGNLAYNQILIPRSVAIAGSLIALLIMASVRYLWRLFLERQRRPRGAHVQRLLVFGAGEGAAQLVATMVADPASPYLPVALLDDDPAKRFLSIKGVRVVGPRHDMAKAAQRYRADALLVAVPSADHGLLNDLNGRAQDCNLPVRVLPSVAELLGGSPGVKDIRPITDADLLGRGQIDLDLESIAGYLTGKRILVTGAGGSIGSELCRQITRFSPTALLLADRDESALHSLLMSLHGHASLDREDVILLDIRDQQRVEQVFEQHKPDVVFHAAALKHVTALEAHPDEAVKTNVLGTLHVLEAAAAVGVERFVNISTDKAADPINVLGYTKRIAERLTATIGAETPGEYLSVRFGNVLSSRGSVLTVFRDQIERGGPITVTHPDATRYFMTVQEACQLVIQAGAIGISGETLVLDMGEPVRIASVAQRLAEESSPPIPISFTGLRPGEKLHEELFADNETDVRPHHVLISHTFVPVMDLDQCSHLPMEDTPSLLRAHIREMASDVTLQRST